MSINISNLDEGYHDSWENDVNNDCAIGRNHCGRSKYMWGLTINRDAYLSISDPLNIRMSLRMAPGFPCFILIHMDRQRLILVAGRDSAGRDGSCMLIILDRFTAKRIGGCLGCSTILL